MEHVCVNCVNYDEYTCLAHSCAGCEARVKFPESYGKECKDFEPYDDSEDGKMTVEDKWEW